MAATKRAAAARDTSRGPGDASRGSRRHLFLVVGALVVGFIVVRKLQGSSTPATVPATSQAAYTDPNTGAVYDANGNLLGYDNANLGGSSVGSSQSGGVAVAGDGTPAIGQSDLATALQPLGDTLSGIQSEVDANTSALAAITAAFGGGGGGTPPPATPTTTPDAPHSTPLVIVPGVPDTPIGPGVLVNPVPVPHDTPSPKPAPVVVPAPAGTVVTAGGASAYKPSTGTTFTPEGTKIAPTVTYSTKPAAKPVKGPSIFAFK